ITVRSRFMGSILDAVLGRGKARRLAAVVAGVSPADLLQFCGGMRVACRFWDSFFAADTAATTKGKPARLPLQNVMPADEISGAPLSTVADRHVCKLVSWKYRHGPASLE